MKHLLSSSRLAPDRGRLALAPTRVRLRRRGARPVTALTEAQETRFLAGLAEGAGFDAACLLAGLNRADVLLARARNARFAEAWDQVADAKRAAMETMLLDRGAAALRAPPAQGDDGGLGLEKPTVALLQWMLGAPRTPRAAKGAEARGAEAKAPTGGAAEAAPLDDAEAEAILAKALAQLEAAEAAMMAGGGTGADDGPR